jgi:hypothetical protein
MNEPNGHQVKIEIIIKGGKLEIKNPPANLLNEFPIKDGINGTLTITDFDILDKDWLAELNKHEIITICPKETSIYFGIRPTVVIPTSISPKQASGIIQIDSTKINTVFTVRASPYYVQVILQEELKLHKRGTELPRLEPCTCFIPLLDDTADSLNEAYKKIVQVYETHRRSNAGNVFQLGLYFDHEADTYRPLDALR